MKNFGFILLFYVGATLAIFALMSDMVGLMYSPFLATYTIVLLLVIGISYFVGSRSQYIQLNHIRRQLLLSLLGILSVLLSSLLIVSLIFYIAAQNTLDVGHDAFLKFSAYIYITNEYLSTPIIAVFFIIFFLSLFLAYINGRNINHKSIIEVKNNISKAMLSIAFISHLLFVSSAGIVTSQAGVLNAYAADFLELHYRELDVILKKYKSYQIIENHIQSRNTIPSDYIENLEAYLENASPSAISRHIVYEYHYRKGMSAVSGGSNVSFLDPTIDRSDPLANIDKAQNIEKTISNLHLLTEAKKDTILALFKEALPSEISLPVSAMIEGISDAIATRISISSWPVSSGDIVAMEVWWNSVTFSPEKVRVDLDHFTNTSGNRAYEVRQLLYEEDWRMECLNEFVVQMRRYSFRTSKYSCWPRKFSGDDFGLNRTSNTSNYNAKEKFQSKYIPEKQKIKWTWDKFFKMLAKSI
jgi:hypothetical protein